MKQKILLALLVLGLAGLALLVAHQERSLDASGISEGSSASVHLAHSSSSQFPSSVQEIKPDNMPVPNLSANSSSTSSVGSSITSSAKSSLSYPRVDPSPQIKDFLAGMDETAVPKVETPEVKRDELFNYTKATPAELKAKALSGDPYAAFLYASYVRLNGFRVKTDRDFYYLNPDVQQRNAALQEMREFLIRAMNGGVRAATNLLSQEYAYLGNRVESLAWRKIAFAMGESERFDCLRDSTTCVVKDFNNLNSDELFYPCVKSAYNQCSRPMFEDATLLALQYLNSMDYAIQNTYVAKP